MQENKTRCEMYRDEKGQNQFYFFTGAPDPRLSPERFANGKGADFHKPPKAQPSPHKEIKPQQH